MRELHVVVIGMLPRSWGTYFVGEADQPAVVEMVGPSIIKIELAESPEQARMMAEYMVAVYRCDKVVDYFLK